MPDNDPSVPLGLATELPPDLAEYVRRELEEEQSRGDADESWRWRMWEFGDGRWPK